MDHDGHQHGLRHRAAQFLTWLIGSTQTREQYTQSDRQQADGFLRSQDDPDARHRQAFAAQEAAQTWRERFQAWGGQQGPAPDAQERQQQRVFQRGGWGHGR